MKYEPILNDIKYELKSIRKTQVRIFTLIAALIMFLIANEEKRKDKDISALLKTGFSLVNALNVLSLAEDLNDLIKKIKTVWLYSNASQVASVRLSVIYDNRTLRLTLSSKYTSAL